MNSLVRIIGPAPSELSFADLVTRVRVERERVRLALEAYREAPKAAKAKGKTKESNSLDEILSLAKSLGVTLNEVKEYLKGEVEG